MANTVPVVLGECVVNLLCWLEDSKKSGQMENANGVSPTCFLLLNRSKSV